jgi:hypothetical protein
MAIIGFISLVMLALVFRGPQVFEGILPESAMAFLDDMSLGGVVQMGGGNTQATSGDDPMSQLRDSTDGWKSSDKIAALPGNRAVFVSDVVSGRRVNAIKGTAPASVDRLEPLAGCAFTPPTADAFVGHVSSWGDPKTTLALATYNDTDLANAVRQFAKIYRKAGIKQIQGLKQLKFSAFDVVVTETEKPVYLVLQGSNRMWLWNIQLAPGARLERIVLLGGTQAGVVNIDPAVPVEVLRDAEAVACNFPGAVYPLNPGHMLFQSLQAGHLDPAEAEETLGKIAASNAAYDAWFRRSFGVSANETMAGNWYGGSIAVVGPVLGDGQERVVWQPVKNGRARITFDTYVDYPALAAEGADFTSRVVAIATSFAWGDLKNLKQEVNF